MKVWLIGIPLLLIASGNATAGDSVPLPKDVPPVLGIAIVSDPGQDGESSEWKIRLTLPKIAWEVVGEMVPKKQWPELKTEVRRATLSLEMGGPSQLVPSRVVDLRGNELSRDQVIKQLEKDTPVLVSVTGRMPDAYFLQLTRAEALIVILGPRDGNPAPEYLPAKKVSPTRGDKGAE